MDELIAVIEGEEELTAQVDDENGLAAQIDSIPTGGGAATEVIVTPKLTEGVEIADISVDGLVSTLYAPEGGSDAQADWNEADPTAAAYIRNKPDKLPADGGNADTVGGYAISETKGMAYPLFGFDVLVLDEHSKELVSTEYDTSKLRVGYANVAGGLQRPSGSIPYYPQDLMYHPNLLINPDFRINQRGQASYTDNFAYTVDRWSTAYSAPGLEKNITPTDNGIVIVTSSGAGSGAFMDLEQKFENALPEGFYAISAKINGEVKKYLGYLEQGGVLYDGLFVLFQNRFAIRCNDADMHIEWVKLEIGEAATVYIPPDTATELAKCQRYYQIRSTADVNAVDLRPSMVSGAVPTVTAVSGGFAYSTEL